MQHPSPASPPPPPRSDAKLTIGEAGGYSSYGEVVINIFTAPDFDLSEAEIAQLEQESPLAAYDWREAQRETGRHDVRHRRGGPRHGRAVRARTRTRAREHRPAATRRTSSSSSTASDPPAAALSNAFCPAGGTGAVA